MAKEKAERRENDHYVTPDWAIRRFLERYAPPAAGRILDPCAARGELIVTAKEYFRQALFAGCDINPEYRADLSLVTDGAVVSGDFLQNVELLKKLQFDLVLTNPPYILAEEFIKAALQVAPVVAMLLRINFLATKKRRDFLAAARPAVYVLPNRPSFDGDGGDMTEYAWFVFGDNNVLGQLDWLDLTPAEEIKAANKRARVIHAVPVGPVDPLDGLPALYCRDCGTRGYLSACGHCGGEAALMT